MRTRPKLLIFLSIALVLTAASLPIQVALLFEHTFWELGGIFGKLTIMNWAVMITCMVNAYFVYQGSRWMLVSAISAILVVNLNNIAVASVGINYSAMEATLATLGFLALHAVLVHPDVRMLLQIPTMRWWRIPPRKPVAVEMKVRRLNGEVFQAQSHDLSRGGTFIPFFSVAAHSRSPLRTPLVPNDLEFVMLDFKVNDKPYSCQAKVVRKTDARGTYPAGMGLQFVNLTRKERREIDRYIRNAPSHQPSSEQSL